MEQSNQRPLMYVATHGTDDRAALAYAKRSVPMFPCEPGAKRPLTRNGHCDATTDPRVIGSWWKRWPTANVGVPTGKKSGLVVLDVDLARSGRWLDPHIKAGTVGRLLKPGENVVELDGRPFNVRREVDQIYLLGDFACVEDCTGFRLAPPRPLGLGSWRRLGYPGIGCAKGTIGTTTSMVVQMNSASAAGWIL